MNICCGRCRYDNMIKMRFLFVNFNNSSYLCLLRREYWLCGADLGVGYSC